MILDIVQIGNYQGIRIPKSILEECGINKKIDLEVKNNTITIKPVEIRKGWEEAFKEMHVKGDDALLIEDSTDMDNGGWEW